MFIHQVAFRSLKWILWNLCMHLIILFLHLRSNIINISLQQTSNDVYVVPVTLMYFLLSARKVWLWVPRDGDIWNRPQWTRSHFVFVIMSCWIFLTRTDVTSLCTSQTLWCSIVAAKSIAGPSKSILIRIKNGLFLKDNRSYVSHMWEGCVSPWCNTLRCAWMQWFSSFAVPTTWKLMNSKEHKQTVREKSKGTKRTRRRPNKNRQRTLKHVMTCAWVIFPDTRCDTLSRNVMCVQSQSVRDEASCERYLSKHTPSVTVDRYRL